MSVATKGRRKIVAATEALASMTAVWPEAEAPQVEKLHGATFESESGTNSEGSSDSVLPEPPVAGEVEALLDNKITELLEQIGMGFQADDATNFEKLTIARDYGPLLWDLKALVPHGSFKAKLRERFPKVNYAKCNRWMYLAKHEDEIQATLSKYPEVAWGPKKMIDFLKRTWLPKEEAEDDEEEYTGYVREDHVEEEPLGLSDGDSLDTPEPDATSPYAVGALNPDFAAAVEDHQQSVEDETQPGTTAGPVTQAVRTRPHPVLGESAFQPAINRTEFEVEIRIGFKLSVPDHVTAEAVAEAIRHTDRWTVGLQTPFEYEMSERGVVVSHVRPWADPAENAG